MWHAQGCVQLAREDLRDALRFLSVVTHIEALELSGCLHRVSHQVAAAFPSTRCSETVSLLVYGCD